MRPEKLLPVLFLAFLGCGGPTSTQRPTAVAADDETARWSPPAEWAHARDDTRPVSRDDWQTAQPDPPPRAAAVTRVDLRDPDALASNGFVEQFGEATSAVSRRHLRLEVQTYGRWTKDLGPYDDTRWWWHLDHTRGWAVEARLRIVRAADPGNPACGAGIAVGDSRGLTQLAVSEAGVGVTLPHHELHPVPDVATFHTYRFERERDFLRVLVDGRVLFETDAEALDQPGGGRRLGFGQLGGCRGGSTQDWRYIQYETAPTISPGCPSCAAREHPQLARLRRALGGTGVRTTDTEDGALGCMARAAFDETARVVVPSMLRRVGLEDRAEYLAALPPLRTRADAPLHLRHVTATLTGVDPRLMASRQKSASKRTPPSEPLPPRAWLEEDWRAAYEALEGGVDAEALRRLRAILAAMLAQGVVVQQDTDAVVRAMVAAALRSGY